MSPQSLREYNGSGGSHCRFENDQMERLISSIEGNISAMQHNSDKIAELNKTQNTYLRWMLGALIVIALGQSGVKTLKEVISSSTAQEHINEK